MKPIRLAIAAQTDLIEIWSDVTAYRNSNAADKIIDHLAATYENLAKFPEMGRRRDDLFPGYRSFVVAPYLIFYQIRPEEIEIIRVLHGARNLSDFF
jgi:toxin ParE1/3/4